MIKKHAISMQHNLSMLTLMFTKLLNFEFDQIHFNQKHQEVLKLEHLMAYISKIIYRQKYLV